MGNYKIKINIGIYDGSGNLTDGVVVASEWNMTESEAESIDAVEKAGRAPRIKWAFSKQSYFEQEKAIGLY